MMWKALSGRSHSSSRMKGAVLKARALSSRETDIPGFRLKNVSAQDDRNLDGAAVMFRE